MVTAALWFVRNCNIHKDINVRMVKNEIARSTSTYLRKLDSYPISQEGSILSFGNHTQSRGGHIANSVLKETSSI